MKYAQLVIGPAGCGKSTYCATIQNHCEVTGRPMQVINLDPAAEHFTYSVTADIRDLVNLPDGPEYGPNGGLIFCMEYLMTSDGVEWLEETVRDGDDDYTLFDCPGQIELYTHMDVFQRLGELLTKWNFAVCVVFVLDSHFVIDSSKYISACLTALSSMVRLELPHVNILTKMDQLSHNSKKNLDIFLELEMDELLVSEQNVSRFNKKFHNLSCALAEVIKDYSLVRFIPLNIYKEESVTEVLYQIDLSIQYGEDADVKTKDFDYPDEDPEMDENFFQTLNIK